MVRNTLCFLLFSIVCLKTSYGQNVDSLLQLLSSQKGEARFETLRALGGCYKKVDVDSAFHFSEQAFELAKTLMDDKKIILSEFDLGIALYRLYEDSAAWDHIRHAHLQATALPDPYLIGVGNLKLAILLEDFPSQSLEYLFEAQRISKENEFDDLLAESNMRFGRAYTRMGLYQKSLDHSLLSLRYYESVDDHRELANIYNGIGNVYLRTADLDAAMEAFNNALKWNRKIDKKKGVAMNLHNIGVVYQKRKEFEKALDAYIEVLDMEKTWGRRDLILLGNIGKVKVQMGNTEEGLIDLLEAKSLYEKSISKHGLAHILNDISETKALLNDGIGARDVAREIIALSTKDKDYDQLRYGYLNLSNSYKLLGEYDKALESLNKFVHLNDSLFGVDKSTQINQLQIQFDTEKKEQEIENLKTTDELKTEALNAQRRQNSYLLAFSLIVFLILVLLGFLYRKVKKSEQRIGMQNHELKQLNTTKDRFFGIIAHDLRNPVVSFLGISKLINGYVKQGKTDQIVGLAGKIDHSVQSLNALLDNLLNWAASQSGTLPYNPEPLSVHQNVTECFALFKEMADSKSIKLVNNLARDLIVMADKNAVSTIFRNLINNALKFTHEGGEINIDAEIEGEHIKIITTDNGVGIDQQKIKSIFALSSQASTEGTKGEKGTGLGLVLCREFVEINQGRLWVESVLGSGTRFYFTLPRHTT